MYIIREIFYLQFGKFRQAKDLIDIAIQKRILLQPKGYRILTDFTGEGYRLILELPYASLAEYEKELGRELGGSEWKAWYDQFKLLVKSSAREILKEA